MKQNEIQYWKRKYLLTYIIWIFTVITMVGLTMNFVVIANNSGKMPVKIDDLPIKYIDTHFSYENNDEINYYFLADNHQIMKWRLSLGDIFMFFSLLIVVILHITVMVYDNKS